jgi:isocitrate dehydrogenase
MGEYLALAESFQHLGEQFGNDGAKILAEALNTATAQYLDNDRLPRRGVHELDNRGSMFYLTLYWAQALAAQGSDAALAERFKVVASALAANEEKIITELDEAQGAAQDIGGYYMPNVEKAVIAMRPSKTFNEIIDNA